MDHYNIPEYPGNYAGDQPIAAATIIPNGALVAKNAAGNLVPAASTVTGHVVGRADVGVDNSAGAAGDLSVRVRRGVYVLQLDADNPPTKAHIGMMVYSIAVDTVAYTGTCRAGRLIGFMGTQPIVDTRFAEAGPTVTLTSTDGTAAGAADLAAIKAEAEKIGDDVRAMHAALKALGVLA